MAIQSILGRKIGMTRYFKENGESVAVTAIQVGPCVVLEPKTKEKHGYTALRVGMGERREKSFNRPELGQFKKLGLKPLEFVREIKWDGQGEVKPGDRIGVEVLENAQFVDITGTTKGRGFAGVVRRWSFHGGPATHGQSDRERHPGSLGRQGSNSKDVIKGKRMAGHWGNEQVTHKDVPTVKVLKEQNVLLVDGPVPGYDGAYCVVAVSPKTRKAAPVKRDKKVQVVKKK
jgi:large subunit ribosomal protein L3